MAMMNQGDGSTDSLLFLSQTSFSLNRFAVRFFISILQRKMGTVPEKWGRFRIICNKSYNIF